MTGSEEEVRHLPVRQRCDRCGHPRSTARPRPEAAVETGSGGGYLPILCAGCAGEKGTTMPPLPDDSPRR
jgi:hypothetical protein